jgi:hypothetical protein
MRMHLLISKFLFSVKLRFLPAILAYFVLLIYSIVAQAQVVYTDGGSSCSEDLLIKYYEGAMAIRAKKAETFLNIKRFDILELDDVPYLFPDGLFDVYVWREDSWHNLYFGNFLGYNFGAKKFVADGTFYSFGGYGYWNTHGQLIAFDRAHHEWELVQGTLLFENAQAYLNPSRVNLHVFTRNNAYTINLQYKLTEESNLSHSVFEPLISDIAMHYTSFELDSFLLVRHRKNSNALVRKKDHQVFFQPDLTHKTLDKINVESLIVLRGNDIVVIDPKNRYKDTLTGSELASYYGVFEGTKSSIIWFYILLICILFTGAMAFLVYRKYVASKEKYASDSKDSDNNIINALLPYVGQKITVEQLDVLLGIHQVSSIETQRHRRAKLIKTINHFNQSRHGRPMIIRIQDPADGRRYLYRIGG